MAVVQKLEEQLDIPPGIRMHWTGCPNSCGQVPPPSSTAARLGLLADSTSRPRLGILVGKLVRL